VFFFSFEKEKLYASTHILLFLLLMARKNVLKSSRLQFNYLPYEIDLLLKKYSIHAADISLLFVYETRNESLNICVRIKLSDYINEYKLNEFFFFCLFFFSFKYVEL
jgi:hypothetical protein